MFAIHRKLEIGLGIEKLFDSSVISFNKLTENAFLDRTPTRNVPSVFTLGMRRKIN